MAQPASRPVIAVGGENLIDEVTRNGETSTKAGGSPFNVAMALGRQDARVDYVSPISTDRWGDILADTLTASNVRLTARRVDLPTTMARVMIEDGTPTYAFERDGTAERAIDIEGLASRFADADCVHSGSLALTDGEDAAVWEMALRQAHDAGRFVSLDPNVRLMVIDDLEAYRDRIRRMLGHVHLLKLSDEDLAGLFPGLSEDDAIASVLDLTSAGLVVMTRGPEGVTAWLDGEAIHVPRAPVDQLVDTVGAGDTFMATLIAGLDRIGRLSPEAIGGLTATETRDLLRRASMAAAINCTREGCDPPTLTELETALAE